MDYKGEHITYKSYRDKLVKHRSTNHPKCAKIGYTYFLSNLEAKDNDEVIDATEEKEEYGLARIVNHSSKAPNLQARSYTFRKPADGGPRKRIALFALKHIGIGEELTYDYGDKNPANIALNPWLVNT